MRSTPDPPLVSFLLNVCDWIRRPLVWAGVEYEPFRALLRAKLVLDHRRGQQRTGTVSMIQQAGFAMMLGIYALMGFGIGGLAWVVQDPVAYMTIAMTFTTGALALPLLLDFAHLLIDTADIDIIAPLPISERSFLAVRVLHVAMYVGVILASLAIGPLLLGPLAFKTSAFFPAYFIAVGIVGATTLLSVLLLYLLVLHSVDVSRFQDALVYVQIASVVVLFGGLQLGPRLLDRWGVIEWFGSHPDAALLYPPAWTGGLLEIMVATPDRRSFLLLGLAIGTPLLMLGLVQLLTRGGLMRQLHALARTGAGRRRSPRRHGLSGRLAPKVCRGPIERAGYDFFLGISSTDRGFKMRTWPGFTMSIVPMVGVLAFRGIGDTVATILPYFAYIPMLLVTMVAGTMRFSDHFEAAWCTELRDAQDASDFHRGALKALLVRFWLIPLVVLTAIFLAFQPGLFVDLAFVNCASAVLVIWYLPLMARDRPFSLKFAQDLAMSNAGTAMLLLLFLAAGIALQVGARTLPGGLVAGTVALSLIAIFLWRSFLTRRVLPGIAADSGHGRRTSRSRRRSR